MLVRLQISEFDRRVERQLFIVHLLLQLRNKIVDFDKPVDLIAADTHILRNDLVGALLRFRACKLLHFAAPSGLSCKGFHLHFRGTGKLGRWNVHAVQVAVNDFHTSGIIVHLCDNNRHRVIQTAGNVMTAVAGNQLQAAFLARPCFDRFIDAVVADGFIQFDVVFDFAVDRKRMIEELIEIGRMQPHRKTFALLRNRQAVQRFFIRVIQTVLENLRHAHTLLLTGFFRRVCGLWRRDRIVRLSAKHNFCGRFCFLRGRHWLIQRRLFLVGSLCGRLDFRAGLFCTAHRGGILAADFAGNICWRVRLFRFDRR